MQSRPRPIFNSKKHTDLGLLINIIRNCYNPDTSTSHSGIHGSSYVVFQLSTYPEDVVNMSFMD
ncbi:hypothetical protein SERLADRAFT_394694, partial [Serpula lacrymans var. lacrymans S7.9]